jgi:hypothetical protein
LYSKYLTKVAVEGCGEFKIDGHVIHTVRYADDLAQLQYILECNPHPFYSFRGLKNQMQIIIACGLDSQLRAGFWKNDTAAVLYVPLKQFNTIINYFIYYLLL